MEFYSTTDVGKKEKIMRMPLLITIVMILIYLLLQMAWVDIQLEKLHLIWL